MYTHQRFVCLAAAVVLLAGSSPASGTLESDALPKGHVFFQEDFEGPDPLSSWSGSPEQVLLPSPQTVWNSIPCAAEWL